MAHLLRGHVTLHAAGRARVAVLVAQPLLDPLGRVPLLPRTRLGHLPLTHRHPDLAARKKQAYRLALSIKEDGVEAESGTNRSTISGSKSRA